VAKFRVDRGGGEYVFPSLGIVASDGDIVDLPADTDVTGLVATGKADKAPVSPSEAVSDPTPISDTQGA
jgi:hypothetical protein